MDLSLLHSKTRYSLPRGVYRVQMEMTTARFSQGCVNTDSKLTKDSVMYSTLAMSWALVPVECAVFLIWSGLGLLAALQGLCFIKAIYYPQWVKTQWFFPSVLIFPFFLFSPFMCVFRQGFLSCCWPWMLPQDPRLWQYAGLSLPPMGKGIKLQRERQKLGWRKGKKRGENIEKEWKNYPSK